MKIYHEKSGRRVELLPEEDKIKSIVSYDWCVKKSAKGNIYDPTIPDNDPSITYFSKDLLSERLRTELVILGGKIVDYSNDVRDYVQQNLLSDVGDEVYSLR